MATWDSFKFDEHCAKLDTSTIKECVEKDTFNLTDIVRSAHYGLSNSSENSSSLFWTQDFTEANMGKQYTLKPRRTLLTNNPDDVLVTLLGRDLNFAIFVHDENFFLVSRNPLGPNNMLFMKRPFKNFYLDKSCKM